MINRSLILKLFEGFSIQRWNDWPRPFDLIEMDKSSHKMLVAYILGKIEESRGNHIDWTKVIYGGFFELLKKIALSDIKAPVHRMIKESYPEEFKQLNKWVIDQYEGLIDDKELIALFAEYIFTKDNMADPSFRVLRAAHKYSTMREFELLGNYPLNPRRMLETENEINSDLCTFLDLHGLQLLISHQPPYDFMADVEQLRFQIRWSTTPRIPRTSVLGHSVFVACLALLITRCLNPCPARLFDNFFCALFHDMPEAVTRDIIQPVKYAAKGLPEAVKGIEDRIVTEKLVPKMHPAFKEELLYFTKDEFSNRIKIDGKIKIVESNEINDKFNSDEFSPIDGDLIKLCDDIAALIEVDQSLAYGITSNSIQEGYNRILGKYSKGISTVCGIDVRSFFREFRK
jgi:putative hydrolases of HD superfamily